MGGSAAMSSGLRDGFARIMVMAVNHESVPGSYRHKELKPLCLIWRSFKLSISPRNFHCRTLNLNNNPIKRHGESSPLAHITPAPKPAASPSSPPDDRKKAQLSSIRGSLTTIGKLLNPPFHRALAPAGTINPLSSTIRHRSTHTLTPTSATHSPLST
eukprot:scaffold150136_cov65-Cyclotella_meneghiniana.AAC.1